MDKNEVAIIARKVVDSREEKFRTDVCDPRHEEVAEVKSIITKLKDEDIPELKRCMSRKFGWLYGLLLLALLALLGNLSLAYITVRANGGG